jgi:RecQ family ATP-dependent DNA helicase
MLSLSECYKKYSQTGIIGEWFSRNEPDQKGKYGYGFVSKDKYFIHISSYFRKLNENEYENLEGKKCLFITGKDPKRPGNIRDCVLEFILERDIDGDISNYIEDRRQKLKEWDDKELLKLFKKNQEKLHLNPDVHLIVELLLRAKDVSNPVEKRKEIILSVKNSVYAEYADLKKEISSISESTIYEYLDSVCVGFDIEADETNIYQVGMCGKPIGAEKTIVDAEEINKFLENYKNKKFLIVGHNILAWDLPKIRKINSAFSINNPVWDTLFVSWILDPSKRIHALTTSEKAHDALEDAKAAKKLFLKQCKSFHWNWEKLDELESANGLYLATFFKTLRKKNKNIETKFPPPPQWMKDKGCRYIIPEPLIRKVMWVPYVVFEWPQRYCNSEDQVINIKKLEKICTENPNNIYLETLALVTHIAFKHNVQILVRMIPYWIRQGIEQFIPRIIAEKNNIHDKCYRIITYKSLSLLLPEDIQKILDSDDSICLPGGETELLGEPKPIRIEEVQEILNKNTGVKGHLRKVFEFMPSSGCIIPVNEDKNISVTSECQIPYRPWIEYDPVYKYNPKYPFLLYKRFNYSYSNSTDESIKTTVPLCKIPVWIEAGTDCILDSIFLSPVTGRRKQYWYDFIPRFLSILKSQKDQKVLHVLLIEHNEEVCPLTEIFSELGLTVSSGKDMLLRQLEDVYHKHKKRVFVSVLNNSAQIETICEELGIPVCFVIETAPINKWIINSYSLETTDQTDKNWADEEHEDELTEEDELTDTLKLQYQCDINEWKEYLSQSLSSWKDSLNYYVSSWLYSLFNNPVPERVIILDSRLYRDHIEKNPTIKYFNVSYSTLTCEEKIAIELYEEDFGDIERKEPPTDFEAYKKFLCKNWRYPEFKDTQREPVNAIIKNDRDVIVRLPTGEGKSVIFQVPSILRSYYTKKLTIVISPLKALMTDQVERLWQEGFLLDVDYLSSDRESWENNEVYQRIIDGQIKLLYIAPERFRVNKFREAIKRRYHADNGFEYIVIDEVHCVSHWGFEFRPDYLYCLSEIREDFRTPPPKTGTSFIFLSATITNAILKDIVDIAGLNQSDRPPYRLLPENHPHPIREFIFINSENAPSGLYDNDGIAGRIAFIEETIKKANPSTSAVLIFCTRRKHTEKIAEKLEGIISHNKKLTVRYFHAGLPVEERLGVYEELKNGTVHVLVATKAFGMGMDISNLHWCIHLGPPAYLEDYLQEVGRTGRGEKERKEANLEEINCLLLYHHNDFERTGELIHRNKVEHPLIDKLFSKILERAKTIVASDQEIAVIPNEGIDEIKGNQFTKALYWLEKFGRINIPGKLPNIFNIEINVNSLRKVVEDISEEARVARCILNLFSVPETNFNTVTANESEGIITKAFKYLAKTLGLRVKSSSVPSAENIEKEEIEINIGVLYQEAGLARIDDAFRIIGKLQKQGCLTIKKEIRFKRERYADVKEIMWKWLGKLLEKYLIETNGKRLILNEEIIKAFDELNKSDIGKRDFFNNQQNLRVAQRRCVNAWIRLFAYAGIKIRKELEENQTTHFTYVVSGTRLRIVRGKIVTVWKITEKLFNLLNGGKTSLGFGEILQSISSVGNYKMADIRAAIRLLSALGFFSAQNNLVPWSYILIIKNKAPFPTTDDANISKIDKECLEQIKQTNEMAILRVYAMEIFALLSSESRKLYIDEYFRLSKKEELESFIIRKAENLINIDPGLEEQLTKLKDRILDEAFSKKYEELNDEQREICSIPFDKNILVNAGPGAGKTRVLMLRAAHMIHKQKLHPENILILAFNRAVVHEIHSRITELFRQLGYGNYVSRINIHTFHSFAIRNFPANKDEELEKLLHKFTNLVLQDDNFARSITYNIRCIMIDEFQDMNKDFYRLIIRLKEISGAGITIIGDDDQDILLWNRIKWMNTHGDTRFHAHAYEYFKDFAQKFNENIVITNLTRNYRSGSEIISRSQDILSHSLIRNARLKENITLVQAGRENFAGLVEYIRPNVFEQKIKHLSGELNNKKIAILCRSNADCYHTANIVQEINLPYKILGEGGYPLF